MAQALGATGESQEQEVWPVEGCDVPGGRGEEGVAQLRRSLPTLRKQGVAFMLECGDERSVTQGILRSELGLLGKLHSPEGQGRHADCPVRLWYVSAGSWCHREGWGSYTNNDSRLAQLDEHGECLRPCCAACWYVPTGQSVQTLVAPSFDVPAGHATWDKGGANSFDGIVSSFLTARATA